MNIYVGIDIGKFFHVASAITEKGEEIQSFPFPNSKEGFLHLLHFLKNLPHPPRTGLEATAHYWLPLHQFLLQNEIPVSILNPLRSNALRRYYIQPQKTDAKDAFVIANALRLSNTNLTPSLKPELLNLRKLTRHRWTLQKALKSLKNQTRTVLDECLPEYQEIPLFRNPFGQTSLALIKSYPTAKDLTKLSLKKLTHFLLNHSNHRHGLKKATLILKAAKNSIALNSSVEACKLLMEDLLLRYQYHKERIDLIDQTIRSKLPKEAQILLTIPGMNTLLAATIFAEIGPFENFQSADQLVAYSGLSPSLYQSGDFKSTRNYMSKRGSPFLSSALYRLALSSLRLNPNLNSYYKQKIQS